MEEKENQELGTLRVNAAKPLGTSYLDRQCSHGKTPNWWWAQFSGGAWAGPIGRCRCCGADYGYLDFAAYGSQGSEGESHDKTLCKPCGGQVHKWSTIPKAKPGEVSEPSSSPNPPPPLDGDPQPNTEAT